MILKKKLLEVGRKNERIHLLRSFQIAWVNQIEFASSHSLSEKILSGPRVGIFSSRSYTEVAIENEEVHCTQRIMYYKCL